MTLSKAQNIVMLKMKNGAIIGELSDKINGRYEIFTRKPNWTPDTDHPFEHPFIVKSINKNTVFTLLTLGLIHQDDKIADSMKPFGRDYWYTCKKKKWRKNQFST